ncbi:MAG: hypothetical protein GTN73_11245 [Candidatus Aminicenantes bacterium]|nr:hypothetical protein [Candidatus Aminicenantes bacterium]
MSAPINLEETIYRTISGRIVDELTGKGVEGIIITINLEDRQIRTDKNGLFKFENVPTDGKYEIRVIIDKEPYCTQMLEFDVIMEEKKNVILKDIIAMRGGAIEGTIKEEDGTPVSSMNIKVFAENEIPGVYGACPDKDGFYCVSKLPPGKDLKVVAACWNVSKGCGKIVKEGIRIEKDRTTKGVDFVIPDEPTCIYGKVVSREGKPFCAHLTFWKDSEDMGNLMCDSLGSYSMRIHESGSYRIHVGYGDEKQKVSGDMRLHIRKEKRIRMDIIIYEESIEFKTYENKDSTSESSDNLFLEQDDKESLAELIVAHTSAFTEELKDLILDAYLSDVKIKIKSNCLPDSRPDSPRVKMLDRLLNESKPIYVLPVNDQKYRIIERKRNFFRIEKCGSTPRGTSFIYLYPAAFRNSCGSFPSILFHELMHVAGMRDDVVYPNTKKCYGDEAIDTPLHIREK